MTQRDPNRPDQPVHQPGDTMTGEPATGWTQPARDPGPPPTGDAPRDVASDAPTIAWTPPSSTTVEESSATPAEPVRTRPGGSRARWGIAILVTALIAVGGVAAAMLLTGQSAPSSVVGYAPSDSVVYGEVRLDLPGDQRAQLGEFLSRFPGFADQSTLDAKIDDVLDRLVLAATHDEQRWTTDIKPWFGGEIGFSVGALPPVDAPSEARGLAMLTITDAAAARAWFDEQIADLPQSTSQHQGVDLTVFGEGDVRGAMAIHGDKVMLVGDQASVEAAVERGGSGDFGSDETYAPARAAIEGDSLGFVYVDTRAYIAWTDEMSQSMGGMSNPLAGLTADMTPEWMIMRAQARGDALALEVVSPHAPISAADENAVSLLAQHVPASTIALVDAHDYGPTLLELLARLRQEPELAEAFTQIDQALNIVGGQDGLLGWMDDAGFALARDGDDLHGGLLFTPADRAKAERLLTTLRSFASLAGASMGISVRDEEHNGTTMTIIDVGDWRDLAGMAGAGAPGMKMPEGRLEIAYATTDDVVVLGVGPSFVRAVLDAPAGDSLADNGRYAALVERLGAENTSLAFVDVVAIRELVEKLGATDPEAYAAYERDVKPYIEPLDALVQTTVVDGDLDRTTMLVTVE